MSCMIYSNIVINYYAAVSLRNMLRHTEYRLEPVLVETVQLCHLLPRVVSHHFRLHRPLPDHEG